MFTPLFRNRAKRRVYSITSAIRRTERLCHSVGPVVLELEARTMLSLTINPTFAANITSDPNAAAIMATINRTIAAYESFISDNVTVDVTFQEGGGLGGSSGGLGYNEKYADYRSALDSHKTSGNDNTALASLPNQTNDPVNNNERVFVRSPLARALGFSAPSAGGTAGDGTITLNTAICNLDRTSAQDPTHYDLQAVTAHEIDEILGFGSALDASNNGVAPPTGNVKPDDLFRYDENGARSFKTGGTDQAYFSIDGGTTKLARFNQTHTAANAGDYGDWYSFFGGQTPQVQDAFNTQGATANMGVELTRLDILGYTLGSLDAPVVSAPAAAQTAVEGASKAIDLGSFTDPNAAPWGVTVNWGDGSPNTTYFLNNAGALGTRAHTYTEEGNYTVTVTVNDFTSQSGSKTFNVAVSDPAVVGTPEAFTAVEGQAFANKVVASFTDPGGAEAAGNYGATIDWGDGSSSAGTIVPSGGKFLVTGNHTYAEESATDHPGSNPYAVTVTISHEAAPPTTVHSTATVSDPAVIATAVPVTAVEGQAFSGKPVATFTDPGGAEGVGDYSATIDWGDGTTSTGTITPGGGTFTVSGDHTYAEESAADHPGSNPYDITVTISHEAAPTTTVHTSAVVSDPAVVATGGFSFTAVEGTPSATQTVATFTDPGGAEPLVDYSAVIDWGDGTTSAGTITFAAGVYTVQGSHTYATGLGNPADFGNTLCDADPPTYHKPITVTVSHESAPTATAVSDATISIPPGSAHLSADGSLIVVGTTGDDQIHFNPVGNQPRTVDVRLGSSSLGTFTVGAGGRIVVAALSGNDDVQLAGAIQVETALYGGPGNDRLNGGGGRNIEVGCEGDDELNAGKLGDLLVGGLGADRIIGGSGNDTLIAGVLVDGANVEDDQYVDLVGVLNAGQVTLPLKVLDDASVDRLTGAAGIDRAYYNFSGGGIKDIFTDKAESAFDI